MQQKLPYKVLCVCLGNICRSPTAEVVLRTTAHHAGLNLYVDSAGTANYHIGEAPDQRSQYYAKIHGYDLSKLQARQITMVDFDEFDLILAMDENNLHNVKKMMQCAGKTLKKQSLRASLALMTAHDPLYPDQSVPDPYYGKAQDFENVIHLCESSSRGWVQYLQSQVHG
ncbi:low molecular weight phosphotyrosine protein phosphatase [Acinetobacter qingfengensis]|uniref:protein-tyrosine-phosphatase n=1 Tax=Acinetobacter qingfengensis TaxID=1262585 RepID=A0A1E7RE50_9GAMM|nr:low molecular weight protein-tyrosine-phosphatase [Acinetobacter qingfengensis]KAA8735327.1 low molecular weight phosphotyrosine protein phosphatase [Acinetobacter qingfengensis]OEY97445.1 protein-tyrosine-phosphatase [Acinetobacter qingfengensis]